jgi:hypothetical protein
MAAFWRQKRKFGMALMAAHKDRVSTALALLSRQVGWRRPGAQKAAGVQDSDVFQRWWAGFQGI